MATVNGDPKIPIERAAEGGVVPRMAPKRDDASRLRRTREQA